MKRQAPVHVADILAERLAVKWPDLACRLQGALARLSAGPPAVRRPRRNESDTFESPLPSIDGREGTLAPLCSHRAPMWCVVYDDNAATVWPMIFEIKPGGTALCTSRSILYAAPIAPLVRTPLCTLRAINDMDRYGISHGISTSIAWTVNMLDAPQEIRFVRARWALLTLDAASDTRAFINDCIF